MFCDVDCLFWSNQCMFNYTYLAMDCQINALSSVSILYFHTCIYTYHRVSCSAYLGQAQSLPRIFQHTPYNRYPGAGRKSLETEVSLNN